jgi:L-asparaginase II
MVRHGERPTRLYDNCSGKHAGFLTVARHWNIATAGYECYEHPVQQAVAKTLGELSGISGELPWGIDGCAAPSFALPLAAFARACAFFAAPQTLAPERARAMTRIVEAMIAHPELVAGTARVCTLLMHAGQGRVAVKTGAEGFFVGILPDHGLAIALKIDDGAGRAAETAIAFLLQRLGLVEPDAVSDIVRAPVRNTRDAVVGERRPTAELTQAPLPRLAG